MPDYLKRVSGTKKLTEEVTSAIDVLSSLGDFENFKASMLAKRYEMTGEGNNLGSGGKVGCLDIGAVMENIKTLDA